MVKCNKYYAADDMPLLSHDHLSRLHWHTVPAVLWQRINTHQKPWCAATRMPNGNPNQISIIKCWSMLFLLIKTGWAAKRWLQQLHCSAAAVVRCSSGGRTRRELRSCVLWNTSGRAEPWGARLWPAVLHQIRRAVSNSSYLLPPTPLLLFMDIELTLSCLRELCI